MVSLDAYFPELKVFINFICLTWRLRAHYFSEALQRDVVADVVATYLCNFL